MAFGDFDGDDNQDLLVVNDDFNSLMIYCWPGSTIFF